MRVRLGAKGQPPWRYHRPVRRAQTHPNPNVPGIAPDSPPEPKEKASQARSRLWMICVAQVFVRAKQQHCSGQVNNSQARCRLWMMCSVLWRAWLEWGSCGGSPTLHGRAPWLPTTPPAVHQHHAAPT